MVQEREARGSEAGQDRDLVFSNCQQAQEEQPELSDMGPLQTLYFLAEPLPLQHNFFLKVSNRQLYERLLNCQ